MSLVILFFVGSYAVLQAIFYSRLCAAFPMSWPLRAGAVLWLVATLFAPFWSRLFDHAGYGCAAWWCGTIGYTWLALVFWFGCATGLLWGWNAMVWAAGRLVGLKPALALSPRPSFLISLALVLGGAAWGWVESNHIRIREILVQSPWVPPAAAPIRLVQISDMHLGKPRGLAFARGVAAKIRALKPDLLVSTGDLVDSCALCQSGVPAVFREIQPPLGKYAVLGNHEYYVGLASALAFHDAAGFVLLRGTSMSVAPWLVLAGVDDPAARYTRQGGVTDERVALHDVRSSRQMVLLLKHQPTVVEASTQCVDLQLSGHTHGGQIFPFDFLVRLFYRYGPGMHRISDRMLLYVSRGTGTWGAPLRFWAPPEITVFILAPATQRRAGTGNGDMVSDSRESV